jgi:uncharacterized protein
MLLRFGLANHRSIRDYQEVSLVATKLKDVTFGLLTPELPEHSDELLVLPALAFYGANASGKSNVLHGLRFLADAIRTSHVRTGSGEGTPFQPFALDDDSRTRASHYDADIVLGDTRFHYGFEVDGRQVCKEWLYSYNLSGTRHARSTLFLRDKTESEEFYFGKKLKGENQQIARLTRANSLFISAAAQNAHPQLSPIFDFFASSITSRGASFQNSPLLVDQLVTYFADHEGDREEALRFVRNADIGVVGFDFSKVSLDEKEISFFKGIEQVLSSYVEGKTQMNIPTERSEVKLLHQGANKKPYALPFSEESAGTVSLLGIIGPILTSLKKGGLLLVDELNSTLHPLISRALVSLFCNVKTNPGHAQLIFATHDTNLLNEPTLRRDQVMLTEKDTHGATQVFSLSDLRVRSSENLESGYLGGRYGAVPFLASFI